MPRLLRAAVAVLALPVGAAVGVAGTLGARRQLAVLGTDLPVGLGLALVATFLAVALPGALTRSRLGAGLGAAGWVVAVGVLMTGRPEGDVLVAGDALGLSWLGGGLVAVAVGVLAPAGYSVTRSESSAPESGSAASADHGYRR